MSGPSGAELSAMGGGAQTSAGSNCKVGVIDFENMANLILPHGMQSPVDQKVNGFSDALMNGKGGGLGVKADDMIGNGLLDGIGSPFGVLEGLVDAFKQGMQGAKTNGSGDQMYAMQHIDHGTPLTPIGPSGGGGSSVGLG